MRAKKAPWKAQNFPLEWSGSIVPIVWMGQSGRQKCVTEKHLSTVKMAISGLGLFREWSVWALPLYLFGTFFFTSWNFPISSHLITAIA